MNNDLISKSELLESLNDWINENTDINTILRWIEEYEIAYDMEKVVAELKKDAFTDGYGDYTECEKLITLEDAIDDVRNGGKE